MPLNGEETLLTNHIFQTRLREELKRAGIKQNELAEKIDVNYNTISNYVAGRATPSIFIVAKIAKILDVSIDYLAGNTDQRDQHLPETDREMTEIDKLSQRISEVLNELERRGEIDARAKTEALQDTEDFFTYRMLRKKQ